MELKFWLERTVETCFHKAHQMFKKDARTITPEAHENVKAALASGEIEHKTEAKKRAIPRKAAGQSWEDPTLSECPENDDRLFCGDLGNEVNDDVLSKAFARFPTFNMAKVALALALFTLCLATGATSKPVRTIKSPDGDLIDCVERTVQPAFSHPLLKNHKLQETPTNLPNMALATTEDEVSWQIWHSSGATCPEGTVLIRTVGLHKNATKAAGVEATTGHEYAIGTLGSPPPKIYGTKVTMNVWHPVVERPDEFSLGQVWVVSGSYDTNDVNTIEAGWQVYPQLYDDYQPSFFIFWTNDAYNATKCYNLRCRGFVQTSRTILVEGAISPTSTFGGPQTELTIQIWKDQNQGLWWLGVGLNNGTSLAPVGYWPKEIFTRLSDYAENVQWGGEIVNLNISGVHTRTQMGSGYLPESARAAYMRDLEINSQPVSNLLVGTSSKSAYYKIKKFSNTSFAYGGPQHAGAVYLRSEYSILIYTSFSLFFFF